MNLPDWLVSDPVEFEFPTPTPRKTVPATFPKPLSAMSLEEKELEQQTFSIAFESALEQLAEGTPLATFCRSYLDPQRRQLSPGRFRTWIFRVKRRRDAYDAAKAIGAEALEDDLIRIADGLDINGQPTLNDVTRSKLQFDARVKTMGYNNREKYGDIKKVEQSITTNFDPKAATMEQLQIRLLKTLGVDIENESGDIIEGDFTDASD